MTSAAYPIPGQDSAAHVGANGTERNPRAFAVTYVKPHRRASSSEGRADCTREQQAAQAGIEPLMVGQPADESVDRDASRAHGELRHAGGARLLLAGGRAPQG